MLVSLKTMGMSCAWLASPVMLYLKDNLKDCRKDCRKALPTTTTYRRK